MVKGFISKEIFRQNKKRVFIVSLAVFVASVLSYYYQDEFLLLQTKLIAGEYNTVSEATMKKMKEQGCVYDGLLTPRYNQYFNESVAMLKRSKCQYIHRAVETWNIPPNFKEITRRIKSIKQQTGQDFIYGLFFAESVDVTKGYYDPIEKRHYSFGKMCSPGTFGVWGKNTCKPSFEKPEYRRYIMSVTKRAIDAGIRDFTFGQIYYQDPHWKKSSLLAKSIVSQMKNYAKSKGVDISVGAQSNTIDKKDYLDKFDYITGGIGQHRDGSIEDGQPCWSYYFKRDGYCWALLWNKKYKSKANNVLVYLDWNNNTTDDIHRFVRMSRRERYNFLGYAYDFFEHRDVGFLLPLGVVLGNVGGGCYGPTKEFYSASQQYSCKDEVAVKNVLSGNKPLPLHSEFVYQAVPLKMEAGQKKTIRAIFKNTGFRNWKGSAGFKLGSLAPQDNNRWGLSRVELKPNEIIKHNESKTFVFNITAPNQPGKYKFQWQMLVEGEEWFGEPTNLVEIEVMPVGSLQVQDINESTVELNNNSEGGMLGNLKTEIVRNQDIGQTDNQKSSKTTNVIKRVIRKVLNSKN